MDDVRFVRFDQPATTARAIRSARTGGSRPSCLSTVARSAPSTYDIVMYLMPPISPRSWMRTTFLCVTWRASSSSRLKRRSISAAARIGHDLGPNHLDGDRDPSSASQA